MSKSHRRARCVSTQTNSRARTSGGERCVAVQPGLGVYHGALSVMGTRADCQVGGLGGYNGFIEQPRRTAHEHIAVREDLDNLAHKAVHAERVAAPERAAARMLVDAGARRKQVECSRDAYAAKHLADGELLVEEEAFAMLGGDSHHARRDAYDLSNAELVHLALLRDWLRVRRTVRARGCVRVYGLDSDRLGEEGAMPDVSMRSCSWQILHVPKKTLQIATRHEHDALEPRHIRRPRRVLWFKEDQARSRLGLDMSEPQRWSCCSRMRRR
jgi:hypothetical protein